MILYDFFRLSVASVFLTAASAANAENIAPLPIRADIGVSVQLDPTDAIQLSGDAQYAVTWSWQDRPPTSVAEFSDPLALRPILIPDVAGTYVAKADFFAADGDNTEPLYSALVEIGTDNVSPVALIRGRGVPDGTTPLQLDATASFDLDGDAISYQWSVVAQPEGSAPVFADAADPFTTFSMDIEGRYRIGLIVQDATGRNSQLAEYDVAYSPDDLSGFALTEAGADNFEGVGGHRVAPVASTRFDQLHAGIGEQVRIDPYASTDIDGDVLIPRMQVVSTPAGASFNLSTDRNGLTTFSAGAAGDYLLSLSVFDGFYGATDQVLIAVGSQANLRPVSRILPVTTAAIGHAVALDGSQSFDLNNDLITHAWSLLSVPSGSGVTLDATDPVTAFTPDVSGLYVAQLVVNDGQASGVPATIAIVVSETLPVAEAGPDRLVSYDGLVTIDATLSAGDTLDYAWSALGLTGDGSSGTIADASAAVTTIMMERHRVAFRDIIQSSPVYHLKSNNTPDLCQFDTRLPADIAGASESEAIAITLHSRGRQGRGEEAVLVWEIDNKNDYTRDVRLEDQTGVLHGTYTVPGRVSVHVTTQDVGKVRMGAWVGTSRLALERAKANAFSRNNPVCAGPAPSVVQLVVSNTNGISLPDTAFLGDTNLRPVLSAGAATSVVTGETASLNALPVAFDANGDALNFAWSLIGRPEGSLATVSSSDPAAVVVAGAALDFAPDLVGTYLLQLEADDGALAAIPSVFVVELANSAPIAVAAGDTSVFVGETATLDGAGSFDPDGHTLTYNWILTEQPAESIAVIAGASQPLASFTPDRRGTYAFALTVSDYELTSPPSLHQLIVPNRAPVAVLEGPVEIGLGEESLFIATGSSDPDNDPLTFAVSLIASPAGSAPLLYEFATGEFGFRADVSGDYTLELTVSDGIAQTTSIVTVSVRPSNAAPILGALNDVYTVELGLELALDLTGSDANGDITTFFATPLPLVDGLTIDAVTGEVRFRPEAGQEGIYSYTVGISDGTRTDQTLLTIEVVPGTASDTSVYGRVLDAANFANGVETPLAGMPVRLQDAALQTLTDANGTFDFGSLTAGDDVVLIEPDGDGGPDGYLGTQRAITITASQNRDLSPQFLLTPLNEGCATVVAGQDTVLTGAATGVVINIAADTILDDTGALFAGEVCLGSLPRQTAQAGFPADTLACQIYGLSAQGATFSNGITVAAANYDNLPETTELTFWQNGGGSQFRQTALASVDPGAVTVRTTNAALGDGALFTFLPQAPTTVASGDQPTGNRQLTVFEGDLNETYTMPGYTAFNQTQQVGLSYHSAAADPTVIVAGDVTIADNMSLPVTLSTRIEVGGLSIASDVIWTPRQAADGSIPALVGEAVNMRQSMPVDATGLPSGRYPYDFIARANYDCSTVTARHEAEVYVQNEINSPYGVGWSIDGLQKLTQTPDGKVAIIDDDGVATFDPKPTFTEFEDEPLVFPGVGVIELQAADFDGNGFTDIAFGEAGFGRISILMNYGDRNFELNTDNVVAGVDIVPETGEYFPDITSVIASDFTNDGIPDLAFTDQELSQFGTLEGDGFGGFEPADTLPTAAVVLATGDFDQDGFVDIAIPTGISFFDLFGLLTRDFYFGSETGFNYIRLSSKSFDSLPSQIIVSDIDGDGFDDFVYRNAYGANFDFNEGERVYALSEAKLGPGLRKTLGNLAAAGDLNNDGLVDVVVSGTDRVEVFLNETGRTFGAGVILERPATASSVGTVNLIDIDNDDILDLIYSGGGSAFAVYRGIGDGTFQPPENVEINHGVNDLLAVDIDADGSVDLISNQRFSVTIDFSDPSKSGLFISGPGEFSELTRLPDGTWQRRYKDGMIVEFDVNGQQVAEVDPHGNRREFAYGTDGRLATITDQTGGVTSFAYDASGRLASTAYPDGRTSIFTFDDAGHLAAVAKPDSATIGYRYDASGKLVAVTDERGNTTEHQYSSVGSYAGSLFPNGSSIHMQAASALGVDQFGQVPLPLQYVDPADRVTTHIDDKGGITYVLVNQFGAVIETFDPLERSTFMTRNEDNLVIELIRPLDPEGLTNRIDQMEYDSRGNMISMRMAVGTADERISRYEYEPVFNRVVRSTDHAGNDSVYEYNGFGDLIRMQDPEGGEEFYSYNPYGLIFTRTNERGNVTAFDYNARANIETVILPDGMVNRLIYDDYGNIVRFTEAFLTPRERTLVRTFDSLDRVTSEEVLDVIGASIDGLIISEYGPAGNLVASIDETGLRTEYVFNDLNELAAETTPGFGTRTFQYNDSGEMIAETDAEGHTTTYEYDIVGRMIQMVDKVGNISRYTYDNYENPVLVVDARGNETTFEYDVLQRRISRTNPLNQTMSMQYDTRDNLVQMTRENGAVETATYDGLSRRVSVTTADNSISFAYDAIGNLVRAADTDSELLMTYDSRDRLETVATSGAVGPQPATVLTYTYDELGQRTQLTDNLGGVWGYSFDEKSRVENITPPWADAHVMDYDPAGRPTELTNATGRQTLAGYDMDRLTSLEHFQDGIAVSRSGYAYAADGAVNLLRDLEDSSQSETLDYDAANRLLQVSEGVPAIDGGVPIPTEDYGYDALGNRTTSHLSSTYVVDNHNRLLEDSDFTYSYDIKGNRSGRVRKSDDRIESYEYNSVNQLIGYSNSAGTTVSYAYDALGRRIAKTVDGTTTAYVYDIGNMRDLTAHDRLLEFENGVLTKRWLHGQEIDQPLGFETYSTDTTPGAGTAYSLHADRQGSIIAVTNQATGALAARYQYDAFGQRDVTVSSIAQDMGFTGRAHDAETGLYYYRARHYDPATGRFLQSDPLGFGGGDMNLYAYTWNDPANWTDPSGLSPSFDFSALTAATRQMGATAARRVGRGARCVAKRISTFLTGLGRELARGADITSSKTRVTTSGCRTVVSAPKCSCTCPTCGGRGLGAGVTGSSFVRGTEVQTPDGLVAIEDLREGDMVIARDEDGGVTGIYPVTAIMQRQAASVLHLTLEDAAGDTSQLGITAEHPLYDADAGWTQAGELVAGDVVLDRYMQPLKVLAIAVDDTPQLVHNLEIGGAGTYFAGNMSAWAHNGIWWKLGGGRRLQPYDTSTGCYVRKGLPWFLVRRAAAEFASGFNDGWNGNFPEREASTPKKCGQFAGGAANMIVQGGG